MLLAILIVSVLALAASVAAMALIPARLADVHASIVSCFETIESHIAAGRHEDPALPMLRDMLKQSSDRIMALTHPAYLREFRRDQVAAAHGKVRETVAQPLYDEFGGEMLEYPADRKAFEEHMRSKLTPSVAPPDALPRPAPAKAAS